MLHHLLCQRICNCAKKHFFTVSKQGLQCVCCVIVQNVVHTNVLSEFPGSLLVPCYFLSVRIFFSFLPFVSCVDVDHANRQRMFEHSEEVNLRKNLKLEKNAAICVSSHCASFSSQQFSQFYWAHLKSPI